MRFTIATHPVERQTDVEAGLGEYLPVSLEAGQAQIVMGHGMMRLEPNCLEKRRNGLPRLVERQVGIANVMII